MGPGHVHISRPEPGPGIGCIALATWMTMLGIGLVALWGYFMFHAITAGGLSLWDSVLLSISLLPGGLLFLGLWMIYRGVRILAGLDK